MVSTMSKDHNPPLPTMKSLDPPLWRLLIGEEGPAVSRDGPTNMAIDQALLAAVAAGGDPVLRLYRWSSPTLSFGRNQPARGLYDEEAAADRGIAFVRRPTGGQAVLHDDELTYAVVATVGEVGKPRAAYERINEALVATLRALGVEAALAGEGGALTRARGHGWTDACFRRPARGEVVVGGRKLVGSAQRTESRTILQHGSILLGGSQAAAEELLVEGAGSGGTGWTTVEAELGRRPSVEAWHGALVSAFETVLGIRLARRQLTVAEESGARELRERFASVDWTWRR